MAAYSLRCDQCRARFLGYAQSLIGAECKDAQQDVYCEPRRYSYPAAGCDGTLRLEKPTPKLAADEA